MPWGGFLYIIGSSLTYECMAFSLWVLAVCTLDGGGGCAMSGCGCLDGSEQIESECLY